MAALATISSRRSSDLFTNSDTNSSTLFLPPVLVAGKGGGTGGGVRTKKKTVEHLVLSLDFSLSSFPSSHLSLVQLHP
jgi:hypothetical protein